MFGESIFDGFLMMYAILYVCVCMFRSAEVGESPAFEGSYSVASEPSSNHEVLDKGRYNTIIRSAEVGESPAFEGSYSVASEPSSNMKSLIRVGVIL